MARGLKPAPILELVAALKRRSSTVAPAAVAPDMVIAGIVIPNTVIPNTVIPDIMTPGIGCRLFPELYREGWILRSTARCNCTRPRNPNFL